MQVKQWCLGLCLLFLSMGPGTALSKTLEHLEFSDLAPLRTHQAKERFLGIALRGEVLRIEELQSLPSGERFVRAYNPYTKKSYGWIQLHEEEFHYSSGSYITLTSNRYRFSQPIVEEIEVGEEEMDVWSEDLLDTSAYKLNTAKFGMAKACNNFIRADGKLGPWGEHIKKVLDPKKHPSLFNAKVQDIKICPNFPKMTVDQKKEFWIWFLAAMANHESTCRPSIKAKARNGTAAGLLQLHYGHESKYGCRKGIKSTKANDNLECGLTMLNNDIRRTKNWFPRGDNYWDVLRWPRPAAKKTLNIVKAYGPCR